VHDVPRQLTVDELAELFEGRTRLVEKLAERDDPLASAREVIAGLSQKGKLKRSTRIRQSARRTSPRVPPPSKVETTTRRRLPSSTGSTQSTSSGSGFASSCS